jgi:hypothetical protein
MDCQCEMIYEVKDAEFFLSYNMSNLGIYIFL